MKTMLLTRRLVLLGSAASLGGCTALSSINAAATPLDTYDLSPVSGSGSGRRSRQTLVVARPAAPAAIATDRIMVKPTPNSITYLPKARWADDLPAMLQSLIIRSVAGTGRIGYVGPSEGGPTPDLALLSRVDAFQVEITESAVLVAVDISLTLLRDRDQQVMAGRLFRKTMQASDDRPGAVVAAFQTVLNELLPDIANWVVGV